MRLFLQYRFLIIILFFILFFILVFSRCINNEKEKPVITAQNKAFEQFAGSDKCISCHKNIYDTHIQTAHFLTSAPANAENIKGSFDTGRNTFAYLNGSVMAMEKTTDSFYQVGYINGIEKKRQRFDITIGSGIKGQSYASWQHNNLAQLPITYFTSSSQWANSPGYPNHIAFNRPITSRCLECHATYATKISEEEKEPEEFDRNRIIFGVDCEKCHGPAVKHVAFQTQNPNDTLGKFIIKPSAFSRRQSLDICALCHGGRMKKTKPSFQFTAGDMLSDFFQIDTAKKDTSSIDVHGNQFALLAASKCYTKTSTLTCISCHNVHENEQGKAALFSQRCISCHSENNHANIVLCKLTAKIGKAIKTNCTNCHMPAQPSLAIAVMLQGATNPTRAMMHTHYIKVYPEESKKILAFLQKK
jgi:nitrate/TMAO reductase-like tetraheme cytochrome c subunit